MYYVELQFLVGINIFCPNELIEHLSKHLTKVLHFFGCPGDISENVVGESLDFHSDNVILPIVWDSDRWKSRPCLLGWEHMYEMLKIQTYIKPPPWWFKLLILEHGKSNLHYLRCSCCIITVQSFWQRFDCVVTLLCWAVLVLICPLQSRKNMKKA